MKCVVWDVNLVFKDFDVLCFDGKYVMGDIDEVYFDCLEVVCNNLVKVDCENV